jgi:hypothetical protein
LFSPGNYMKTIRSTILLVLLLLATPSRSAFCFEFTQGIPNGLGGSLVLSQPSLFSLGSISDAGLGPHNAAVAFGGNRRFDLKEFDQYLLAAGLRYDQLEFGLLLSSFGQSDLYAERGGQAMLAYHLVSFSVGVTASGMRMEFGEMFDDLSFGTIGLTAGWHSEHLLLAASLDNLTEPAPAEGSIPYPLTFSGYAEFRQSERFSLTGKIETSDEKTALGFGQRLRLSEYGELLLGLSTEPVQYGGGINLFWEKFVLTYAVSYHPDLGLSHTVSLLTRFKLR